MFLFIPLSLLDPRETENAAVVRRHAQRLQKVAGRPLQTHRSVAS